MAGTSLSPLTLVEVAHIARELNELVGAQLQDCLQTTSELGLAFYHERKTIWLWFDLNPNCPLVVRIGHQPPRRKKTARPLTLFLRSRFFGRRLKSIGFDEGRGRILNLSFTRGVDEEDQLPIEIEVRLFPRGQNIIAKDGEKSISELKPKPLSSAPHEAEASPRSWTAIEEMWRARQTPGVKASANASGAQEGPQAQQIQQAPQLQKEQKDWTRAVEKKTKALENMRLELGIKTNNIYSSVGEWLKTHGPADFPERLPEEWSSEWTDILDLKQSLSWNIEACFRKAKDNARKAEGTRARIAQVEAELANLQKNGPEQFARLRDENKKDASRGLLKQADARGRKHKIGDDLEIYVGKSAADNLALLRRAQPFDYWLHLRDQPGSHAIMRRTRGRKVSDEEFMQAGQWVVEQSTGKRARELKGERFDLLIVECRYVRPIKGDRLGRVNYTNDRVLSLKMQ